MLARLRLGGEFAQRPRGEPPDQPARASRREFIELDEAHSGWISRSPAAATNTGLSISTSWPDYDRRCGGSRETHCTTACSRLAIGSEVHHRSPSIELRRLLSSPFLPPAPDDIPRPYERGGKKAC